MIPTRMSLYADSLHEASVIGTIVDIRMVYRRREPDRRHHRQEEAAQHVEEDIFQRRAPST